MEIDWAHQFIEHETVRSVPCGSLSPARMRSRVQLQETYRWLAEGGRDPLGILVIDSHQAPIQFVSSLLEGSVARGFGKPCISRHVRDY